MASRVDRPIDLVQEILRTPAEERAGRLSRLSGGLLVKVAAAVFAALETEREQCRLDLAERDAEVERLEESLRELSP